MSRADSSGQEGEPDRADTPDLDSARDQGKTPKPSRADTPDADSANAPIRPGADTPPRRTRLERIYVITNGRSAPTADLDLVTLIVAADAAPPGLAPEQATILRLCRRPLSVAEISAHLRLPFSATAVLVADLLAAGLAVQRRPIRPASIDPRLLEQVINGLRRL